MRLIYIISLSLLWGCNCKDKLIGGFVISHVVTSDKYGNATYRTVIRCDDGYIRERTGLNFFSREINTHVNLIINACNEY